MDVEKTTILNENLEEEIYMEQCEDCILVLYRDRLKQAPKHWHGRLNSRIKHIDGPVCF